MYFSHEHLRAPSTKEEVIETVKMAIMSGRRLRPLGSGHSWSPVAQSDDLYVSLHRYSGLVELDRQKKRVTVRGGTTLHELNAILEEHGLAMTNLPSVSAQTVAGAISTGEFLRVSFLVYGRVHSATFTTTGGGGGGLCHNLQRVLPDP